MILEPKKIKSDTVSTVSPSISHEVTEPDAYPQKSIPPKELGFLKVSSEE